jgi:hypothetical protein
MTGYGCGKGSGGDLIPSLAERTAQTNLWLVTATGLESFMQSQRAPSEIAFIIDASMGPNDTNGFFLDVVKLEINYGDGSGWRDVTADRAFWDYSSDRDPARMTHYEYSLPGTFYVNSRVTFWDGEVVYEDNSGFGFPLGIPIRVLPPEV